MDKLYNIANLYLALLRQMYLIHQYSHWTTTGSYGNHLLFERLYKSAAEDADGAAEKMIGIFGLDAVNYEQQAKFMSELFQRYQDLDGSPVEMSLKIENDFLAFSKQAYKVFDDENMLSMGLDDFIMSTASNREESCYLLQQLINKKTLEEK